MAAKKIPSVSIQVGSSRYCYLEKEIQSARPGLHVACAGHEICTPEYSIKRSRFPCYGLEYVESGFGTVCLNGREYPLRRGVLFIYGPSTFHHISSDPKTPLRKYFVDFFGRESATLIRQGAVAAGGIGYFSELEGFRGLLEMILEEGNRGTDAATKICAGLLRVLIWKTLGAQMDGLAKSGAFETFQRFRHLIDTRYLEFQTLDDVANAAGVNKSYLCRLFLSHRFPSPYNYLIRKKMNRAAQLLISETYRIQEIAHIVGFSDPYHFSRVFKREMGQSPRAFALRRK